MMRVLFATDGSGCAEQALNLLCGLPLPSGSCLRLISVLESPLFDEREQALLSESQRSELSGQQDAVERTIAAGLEQNAQRLRGIISDVSTQICSGHAAEEILLHADSWGADLIVVGSQGQGEVVRFLLGSVSDHVMRYAHCSVLVVRPTGRARIERVLLAYDDSSPARSAAAFLAALPLDERVGIKVMSVLPLIRLFRQDIRQRMGWVWQQKKLLAEKALARVTGDSRWGDREVISELREAEDISESLLECAARDQVDLIVLGYRGRGTLERLLLGSVSTRVAHHAACSILVVRSRG